MPKLTEAVWSHVKATDNLLRYWNGVRTGSEKKGRLIGDRGTILDVNKFK